MTESQQNHLLVARRRAAYVSPALAVALGVCMLSAAGGAAEPAGPTIAPGLHALLATNTAVLSENAMAQQKGSGLQPPPVADSQTSSEVRVLLWDEMRLVPYINPPNDGVVTGGGR